MSSPYDLIRQAYLKHPQERSFEWYWDWHCENGFAYATPEFAVMGRNCYRASIEAYGVKLESIHRDFGDTWYIHGFAGDMSKCWSILPRELPWIAFERIRGLAKELTFVPIGTLRRLSHEPSDQSVLA